MSVSVWLLLQSNSSGISNGRKEEVKSDMTSHKLVACKPVTGLAPLRKFI